MDWTTIKTEYVTSSVGLRALAKKYKVRLATVSDHCHNEGWVEARKQYRNETATKAIDKASEEMSDARADLHKAARAMIAELMDLVSDRGDLKPREITGAMKDCMDILGLKSDDDIAEQRARIEKLKREAAGETQDREITVRFAEGDGWQN